ncbi:putative inactive receptor kinase [Acorus gramineus]|uniref:Inactive receptor kinase n=1 Tax=Acorus gramineus TaxID=55184 RepID=A0AAV9BKY5_ACOGR|nr:putative inactive receptor kinase [Acorus gramineus]
MPCEGKTMQLLGLLVLLWVEFTIAKPDSDALLEFKKGIKEDPLGRLLGSWNFEKASLSDGCPGDWYGVHCTDGHVTSIVLDGLDLAGTIDFSSLVGLHTLQNLSVSHNRLTGALHADIGSIGSLKFLDLSSNSFTGSIPVEFFKLGNLVSLNLSSNGFTGKVPSGFQNLRQLKHLDLRSNAFSGHLDGILSELQSVAYVDLSCNGFSGTLGGAFGDSTSIDTLQYLNVSHNSLSGELFALDAMPLFDSLEVFDASYNQLVGQIPPFNFVVSLKILRLGNNQFTGSLPEALLKESSMVLSELDLSFNQLQGPISSITSATLKNLNLSSNELSGPLPSRVGNCAIVDLSFNSLRGNLSMIASWGNYIETIRLSSNKLTGTLPNETSQFLRLTYMYVSNNSLEGELPLVIGTYPLLSFIDLSLNRLSGIIPPSLFTTPRLTNLNLSRNGFTGQIPLPSPPKAISELLDIPLPITKNSSLVSLDLSYNMLSGTLPPEIGALEEIKVLNIGKNNMSGDIPTEITKLRSLLFLDLSNNHFEGSIPDDLPDSLEGFNVSYNNLSGTVPNNLIRFPDSSFHPGNTLLKFPHAVSSSEGIIGFIRGKHGIQPAIRDAVIAGLVVGTVLIIVFSLFVYYRRSSGINCGKDTERNKDVEAPPACSSFSQDRLLASRSGDMSLAPVESSEVGNVESAVKGLSTKSNISPMDSGRRSPLSMISSSPQFIDYNSSEQPVVLSVCTPDRLAGELHLFDNSFAFTAEELSCAPAEIIGRSCHGTSYKATLDGGRVLIVKWLREGIVKSKKEFSREVKKLGSIRHPNIVCLRGYYWGWKEHEKLVISDYVNAVCLTAHLCEFEARRLPPLSLDQRIKVAVNVAGCLSYLHNERAIPHGNLKSTNILLEAHTLNALVTDYSIHRVLTPAGMAEQVLNAGALGYRPPEFASTNKPCPSLKSDVYALGVVLLELLTGKSAGEIVIGDPGVVDLTDWVRLLASEDRSIECFDRLISGDSVQGPPKLEQLLRVALRCIRSASERPDIRTVYEDLSAIVI